MVMFRSSASTLPEKSVSIVIVRNYPANHDVAIVVGDGVAVFELGVACDVFGDEWAALIGVPWYRSSVCSIAPGPVTTDSGFQILPGHGPQTTIGRERATNRYLQDLPTPAAQPPARGL